MTGDKVKSELKLQEYDSLESTIKYIQSSYIRKEQNSDSSSEN